ncbi:hypothetical protein CLOP_g19728 [Closterium sp. NIES-67]|nr:hypothetical protein CLOP_g19728 [Closterium sp. NIES-67]
MGANSTKAARHVLSTRPHVLKNDLRNLFAHAAESNATRQGQAQSSRFRRRNNCDRDGNRDGHKRCCDGEPACMAVVDGGDGDGDTRGREHEDYDHGYDQARCDRSCGDARCSTGGARTSGKMGGLERTGASAPGSTSAEGCAERCGQGCGEEFPVEWVPSSSASASASASPIIPLSAPIFRRSVPPPYATSSCSSPCSLSLSCCDEGCGLSSTRDSSDAFDAAGVSGELSGAGEFDGPRPQTPLLLLEWQEKVVGEVGEEEEVGGGGFLAVGGDHGGNRRDMGDDCDSRYLRRGGRSRSASEEEDEEDEAFREEGFIVRRRTRKGSFHRSVSTSSDSNKSNCSGDDKPLAGCVGDSSQRARELKAEVGEEREEIDAGGKSVLVTSNATAASSGGYRNSSRIGRSRSRSRSHDRGSQRSHDSCLSLDDEVGESPPAASAALSSAAAAAAAATDAGAAGGKAGPVADASAGNAACESAAPECVKPEGNGSTLKAVHGGNRGKVLGGWGSREGGGRAFWSGHLDVRAAGFGTGVWTNSTGWRHADAAAATAGKEEEQVRNGRPFGQERVGVKSGLQGCTNIADGTGIDSHRRSGNSKNTSSTRSSSNSSSSSSSSRSSRHERALLAAVERLVWHRLRTKSDEPVVPELFYRVHTTEKDLQAKI